MDNHNTAGIDLDKPCPYCGKHDGEHDKTYPHPRQPRVTEQTDERALFEAWIASVGSAIHLERTSGIYTNLTIENEWQAWQARATFASPAVPEGYKLVPIEPTPDMIKAGSAEDVPSFAGDWNECIGDFAAQLAYRAMVAAAPAVGTEKDAEIVEALKICIKALEHAGIAKQLREFALSNAIAALEAHKAGKDQS
jgi:hypothetical protein